MKETPEQKELRIITAVGQTAVKHFVERLREWCEVETDRDSLGAWKQGDWKYARTLLEYADKLIEQMNKENE